MDEDRLLETARSRRVISTVSAVTVLSFLLFPLVEVALQSLGVVPGVTFYDFVGAFYTAGDRFLTGGNLYAPVHNPYVYPPIVVFLFAPFTVVDPWTAGLLWVIFSLVILLSGVWALLRSLDVTLTRLQWAVLSLCLVGFFPTILWIKAGQVSGFLAGLLCYVVAGIERGRTSSRTGGVTGAMTTLVAVVKPFYAPSGAHLLRSTRRFVGAVAGGIFLMAVSLLVFGVQTHRRYLEVLAHGKGWGQTADPGGVSGSITEWGPYFFRPFYLLGERAIYAHFAVAIGVAVIALLSRRDGGVEVDRRVAALGFVTIPLASPIPDLFAVNAVIPAVLIAIVSEHRRPDGLVVVPVGAVFLIHVHSYVLGFFAGFGWNYIPALKLLTPILPFLQAGVWGVFALFALELYRVIDGAQIGESVKDAIVK